MKNKCKSKAKEASIFPGLFGAENVESESSQGLLNEFSYTKSLGLLHFKKGNYELGKCHCRAATAHNSKH